MDSNQTALLDLIATHSFKLGDFTLASGAKSDYYIDCRITTLHAEGGRLAGLVLYDLIREHIPHTEAVGGLTMGADPLVSNIASASAWAAADYNEILELSTALEMETDEDPGPPPSLIHGFLVRKAEKTHGTGRRIEGFLKPGAKVVIVDDVCTTGGSTITAIEAARDAGMIVAGVLCLVDREQGGRAKIEAAAAGASFIAAFSASDVRRGAYRVEVVQDEEPYFRPRRGSPKHCVLCTTDHGTRGRQDKWKTSHGDVTQPEKQLL